MTALVQRGVALALLVASFAAPLATALHLALVPHRQCAEHGTLEHASHDTATRSEPSLREATLRAEDGDGDHGHDGCGLLTARIVATPVILSAPVRSTEAARAPPPARAPIVVTLATRVLDHAPKTSPPT